MKANDYQVGGSHYRRGGIQHWDVVARYDVGYFEAAVSKYLLRYNEKNGFEDINKSAHFTDKLIENWNAGLVKRQPRVPSHVIAEMLRGCTSDSVLRGCISAILQWDDPNQLRRVSKIIRETGARLYPAEAPTA